MSTTADPQEDTPPKPSKMPLVLGLILALAGAGGGYFAVQSGLIGGSAAPTDTPAADDTYADAATDSPTGAAFVPLETIVVNLRTGSDTSLLRFSAALEVAPAYESDVAALSPRILDVLNSYLRAVEVGDLADPAALVRLRSQMLRRVQVVTGPDKVSDLLILEFVLN